MSVYEASITKPKKQLEFYKDLSEQLKEENQSLKKQLDYLRSGEYLNQLKFEVSMLEDIVANGKVSEDKKFIDMTHRNTELLEENQKYKEVIDKLHKYMYSGYLINSKEIKDILKEVE